MTGHLLWKPGAYGAPLKPRDTQAFAEMFAGTDWQQIGQIEAFFCSSAGYRPISKIKPATAATPVKPPSVPVRTPAAKR